MHRSTRKLNFDRALVSRHGPLCLAAASSSTRQPQLGYLGLELGDTGDGLDSGGQPDHLVDPRPLLGGCEVGADPSPDVLGLSDVENVALALVLGDEQIHPWRVRQGGGPGTFGAPLR